jgi:hypothetical protein
MGMRGLTEIIPIQDIFCSGLGAIEKLEGGCFRFYLYAAQEADGGGAKEKVLVAKLVMPISAIPEAIIRTTAAFGASTAPASMEADMLH